MGFDCARDKKHLPARNAGRYHKIYKIASEIGLVFVNQLVFDGHQVFMDLEDHDQQFSVHSGN